MALAALAALHEHGAGLGHGFTQGGERAALRVAPGGVARQQGLELLQRGAASGEAFHEDGPGAVEREVGFGAQPHGVLGARGGHLLRLLEGFGVLAGALVGALGRVDAGLELRAHLLRGAALEEPGADLRGVLEGGVLEARAVGGRLGLLVPGLEADLLAGAAALLLVQALAR